MAGEGTGVTVSADGTFGGIAGTCCSFVWTVELAPSIGAAIEEVGTPPTETLLVLADPGPSSGCTPAAACSAVANACTLAKRAAGSLASAVITTCSTSG